MLPTTDRKMPCQSSQNCRFFETTQISTHSMWYGDRCRQLLGCASVSYVYRATGMCIFVGRELLYALSSICTRRNDTALVSTDDTRPIIFPFNAQTVPLVPQLNLCFLGQFKTMCVQAPKIACVPLFSHLYAAKMATPIATSAF